MSQALAAMLPYTPPGLARELFADPALAPHVEEFSAAVLFADVSGFTPLTEALAKRGAEGPEEMTNLLNSYFSRLIAALEAEGGEVVKFSGDAVMALFPATMEPSSHAARRALQAAASMHEFTGEFSVLPTSAGPIALSVKIGIGIGTVIAFRVGGILDRWEYVVAGDPIKQVAEAEKAAKKGQTVLSPQTAALLGDPATPLSLPSRPSPVPHADAAIDMRAVETALRGFVPGAARAWLGEEVQQWLAALRPMSVLFIGVTGLDYAATDALGRMNTFFTSAQKVVYNHEGSVNKLVVDDKGTVLLVTFGAPPLAHADDPARAAQTARDLLAMAKSLGLSMAVGVATGPVFAGPVGSVSRREYTLMGDTVNRAARLMAAAGTDDIRCDFATAHEARRALAFDTLPPVHLKGKTGLIPVFRPTDGAVQQNPLYLSLIGRKAELARLEAALVDVKAGRQRLLLIEGEAGMGKSRLLLELLRLCHALDLTSLCGAGRSSERQTPFLAWRDVFQTYFGLEGIADPLDRSRLVQAQVNGIAAELAERLPLLNDLLGTAFPETPFTATLETERLHHGREALLIELLGHWATVRPVVLVLDDTQWMDTRSWGLTLAIYSALCSAKVPTLLVLGIRPMERLNRPVALAGLEASAGAELLTLSPLDSAETVALAAARLGLEVSNLPPSLVSLVSARADGNPFFTEEIVLAISEQGLLDISGDPGKRRCTLRGSLDELASRLPDTIQGVILSRIDLLNPALQTLLRVGSVIGRSFPYPMLLAAVSPYLSLPNSNIRLHLEHLAGLDFTSQEAPEPDLRHVFKNAMIREVAYGTILFAQRRELHRRVAQWYEARIQPDADSTTPATTSSETVHLLAYHYQQAGDTERERYYAALAGELAAAVFANAEALEYLNRALELTSIEDRAERRRLLLIREQVHDVCADRPAQAADIATLATLIDAHDMHAHAELALRIASYNLSTNDFPGAAKTAAQATAQAHAIGWHIGETSARRLHGSALIPLAHYDEAHAHLTVALDLAHALSLTGIEDDCLRDLGLIAYHQGAYAAARSYYEQALAINHAIGDRRGESATLIRLGNVARELGDTTTALTSYEQALVLYRATGDRDGEADGLRGIGKIAHKHGDYHEAQTAYTESLAIERTSGDRQGVAACLAALGMLARAVGDHDGAQALLDQALEINQAIGDRCNEAAVHADLALLCSQRDDCQTAHDHAQSALALARTTGSRHIEKIAITRLGHALAALHDDEGAATAYKLALELQSELAADTPDLETMVGLARLALAGGDLAAALTLVEAITTVLESSGKAWPVEAPDAYLVCYRVLNALRDPRASQVLAGACTRLEAQAGQLPDASRRQAFYANVPPHSAILAARRGRVSG